MDIPFEVAKQFCEEYQKDQCIILSWDKKSGETWVTTYGIDDKNSIQATNAGKLLKDHLKLKRDTECIPERFEKWTIESVDKFWYWSSRNGKTFKEITHWYEPQTFQRKETVRSVNDHYGSQHQLPDWAQSITENLKRMNLE